MTSHCRETTITLLLGSRGPTPSVREGKGDEGAFYFHKHRRDGRKGGSRGPGSGVDGYTHPHPRSS